MASFLQNRRDGARPANKYGHANDHAFRLFLLANPAPLRTMNARHNQVPARLRHLPPACRPHRD
jgi:hypothetical protein